MAEADTLRARLALIVACADAVAVEGLESAAECVEMYRTPGRTSFSSRRHGRAPEAIPLARLYEGAPPPEEPDAP
jgi:hypothetical protein